MLASLEFHVRAVAQDPDPLLQVLLLVGGVVELDEPVAFQLHVDA